MIDNTEMDEPGQGQDQGRQNQDSQRSGTQPRRDDQKDQSQRPKQDQDQGKRKDKSGQDEEEN